MSEARLDSQVVRVILILVVVGALGTIVVGFVTLFQQTEQQDGDELVKLTEASPQTVAQSFLSAVRLHHWDSAYLLLTEGARQKASFEQFEETVSNWMDQGQNAWDLKYRRVGDLSLDGTSAFVTIESEAPDSGLEVWEWRLERDDEGWRISELSEGLLIGRSTAK
jgi:hypothetical protein